MRHIFSIVFLLLILFLPLAVLASESIDMNISTSQLTLWDSLKLDILVDMSDISQESIQMDVIGIEDFLIFSQSQWYNYESINGEVKSMAQYTLDLRPQNVWEFSLGPVKILTASWEIIDDKVVDVIVSDIISTQEQTDLSFPDEKTTASSENLEENPEEKISIKWLREIPFPWWGLLGILVLFLCLFYIVLSLAFQKWKVEKIHTSQWDNIPSQKQKMKQYFAKLGEQSQDLDSQAFFKKYNIWIRELLMIEWIPSAHKATLQELQKIHSLQDNTLMKIFVKSYKHEYSWKKVSVTTREKYISDILWYLSF